MRRPEVLQASGAAPSGPDLPEVAEREPVSTDAALTALREADKADPLETKNPPPTGTTAEAPNNATKAQPSGVGGASPAAVKRGPGRPPKNPIPPQLAAANAKRAAEAQASRGTPAPAQPREASLTGKQYKSLKNVQLQTLLAERDNELSRTRARLEQLERSKGERSGDADPLLLIACEETADTIASLAAVAWGDHLRISSTQKKRLGNVWARALEPYIAEHAEQLPIVAAVGATAGIFAEKFIEHRAAKQSESEPARPHLIVAAT